MTFGRTQKRQGFLFTLFAEHESAFSPFREFREWLPAAIFSYDLFVQERSAPARVLCDSRVDCYKLVVGGGGYGAVGVDGTHSHMYQRSLFHRTSLILFHLLLGQIVCQR